MARTAARLPRSSSMTVSSRLAVLFAAAGLVALGLSCFVEVNDTDPATTCAPAPSLVPAPPSRAEPLPVEASVLLAAPKVVTPRMIPPAGPEPARPPTDEADPEAQLIAGNVDLATQAIELAQRRAADAPGLAAAEDDYALAAARQSQRAREAGYPSADAN